MPVYRKGKLIHIHIPKTGGTAIESFFHSIGDMVWGRESWLGQERIRGRWYEYQHLTMWEFRSFSGDRFDHFGSFAVIRNPCSRLISEFLWHSNLIQQRTDPVLIPFESFPEFIRAIPRGMNSDWDRCVQGLSIREANFVIHVRPQHHYVVDDNATPLVGDVLKFEQLESDFSRLLGRHGLRADRIRDGRQGALEAYFDRKLLDCVNEIYAEDFRLGRYEML